MKDVISYFEAFEASTSGSDLTIRPETSLISFDMGQSPMQLQQTNHRKSDSGITRPVQQYQVRDYFGSEILVGRLTSIVLSSRHRKLQHQQRSRGGRSALDETRGSLRESTRDCNGSWALEL